jgi:diguanylate cyclase (GGDEF)-like protein
MVTDETIIIRPAELLEFFRSYRFLDDYSLEVYCKRHRQVTRLGPESRACRDFAAGVGCGEFCGAVFEKAVMLSMNRNKPVVFRCRAGLLNFSVPFSPDGLTSYCLVGGGLREQSVDLSRMEKLARSCNLDAFSLLEKLEDLPVSSLSDVKQTAVKVGRIISSFQRENLHSRLLDKTMNMLDTVAALSAHLDRSSSADEVAQLLNEALLILFDLPKIAIVLRNTGTEGFSLQASSGLSVNGTNLTDQRVQELFSGNCGESDYLTGKEVESLFPGVESECVLCLPFRCGDELLGFLALFDAELHKRDIRLLELLAGRLSSKLMLQMKEEESARGFYITDRLMTLPDSILSSASMEELYRNLLETAADLLQASSGSLMLVDEDGKNLRIESAIGMNPRLAKSMKLEIGSGISGKVASSGKPMLVNNVEEDKRVGIRNRYRFKTKSFISVPIRVKGKIAGVLNFSDKKNGECFTKQDLDLLDSMLKQACMALDRSESEEKAEKLERLSMNDTVTGLFNRRFMEMRLKEELSRCNRRGDGLAVVLIDLDNFRVYNERCGGNAGDGALKKTALLLRAISRQMDTVTRFDGGMFGIIAPGASASESFIIAERIRSKIENAPFLGEEALPMGRLTASIGISLFPENGETVENLLQFAGLALQSAKAGGRNRAVHYTPEGKGGGKVVSINTLLRKDGQSG